MWLFQEIVHQQLNRGPIITDSDFTSVRHSLLPPMFSRLSTILFSRMVASHHSSMSCRKTVCWLWTRLHGCRTAVLSSHYQIGEYSVKKSKEMLYMYINANCNKYVRLGYCYQSKAKLWSNLFHAETVWKTAKPVLLLVPHMSGFNRWNSHLFSEILFCKSAWLLFISMAVACVDRQDT